LCVTGEDKVARFGLIVAGEAGFHERLVGRFAILEMPVLAAEVRFESAKASSRSSIFVWICQADGLEEAASQKPNASRSGGIELAPLKPGFCRRECTGEIPWSEAPQLVNEEPD